MHYRDVYFIRRNLIVQSPADTNNISSRCYTANAKERLDSIAHPTKRVLFDDTAGVDLEADHLDIGFGDSAAEGGR